MALSPGILGVALLLGAVAAHQPDKWELCFTENFDGSAINPKLWRRLDFAPGEGKSDWNRNVSGREDLVEVKGGSLHLYGKRNIDSSDPRAVLAGGISSQGFFAMQYGKVELRVRFEPAKGAWPAIWMMPQKPQGSWPDCGEIDILERLNYDPFVYHTVHSGWTRHSKNSPVSCQPGAIKPDAWNVVTLEWTPEKLVWRVNGSITHRYLKADDSRERWPWDYPFYIMLDMQLGGSWVGPVDESTLPAAMHIDWIKIYRLKRGNKRISKFIRPK